MVNNSISYLLKQHETLYNQMAARINPDEISAIFAKTEVNNCGRAMVFLTLVYVMKESESATRWAVRLVAVVLKGPSDHLRLKTVFFQRMVSYVRCAFTG